MDSIMKVKVLKVCTSNQDRYGSIKYIPVHLIEEIEEIPVNENCDFGVELKTRRGTYYASIDETMKYFEEIK